MSSRIVWSSSKTPLVATAFPTWIQQKLGKCVPKRLRDQRPSAKPEFQRKSEGERQSSFQEINRKDNDSSFLPKSERYWSFLYCLSHKLWKKIFPIHNPEGMEPTDKLKLKHLFLSYFIISKANVIEKAISGVQLLSEENFANIFYWDMWNI